MLLIDTVDDYIYWLSQIEYSEQSLVGDKLYILSQLIQQEIPISPGFVLSNELLRQFLSNSDDFKALIQELANSSYSLNVDDYLSLQSVASRSRQIIERSVLPAEWKSAIFEAARQLNCDSLILQPFFTTSYSQDISSRGIWRSHTCSVHPEALSQGIKQVWSELFTAKSLLYRHRLGLSREEVNLAILVRPLKNAWASGTVEIAPNVIKIKANWGLQHSLLKGEVESDRYYLDRHTGYVLSRHLGRKNYSYRVKSIDPQVLSLDCLEVYIPDQNDTEYVLDSRAIAILFELIQNVLQKQPQIQYLVWTVPVEPEDKSPHFYLIELDKNLNSSVALLEETTPISLPSNIEPILTGVSAAPGGVVAPVVVVNLDTQLESIPNHAILVIKNITPHYIPLISKVKGIITETGGKTSHGAIVARELNIPAVVNAIDATTILENGIEVFLSGDEGKVYPATAVSQLSLADAKCHDLSSSHQPITTKLMVNISRPESITRTLDLPIDGVGLLRSELLLADILTKYSPDQWRSPSFQAEFTTTLTKSLRQFVAIFNPRPIFYRSLDRTTTEINAIRGTYSYTLDRTLFDLELNILSAIATEGYNNLNLILPFVRSVEEFKFCDRQLKKIGLTKKSFQVWIMAEVPSVVWLLPEYIRAGIDGIAIGTNDLTQLILGVDREQASFSDRGLNANHPAVRGAIAQLVTTAKDNNIQCSICGQAPVEHPDLIDKLIEWGITSISVEPEAVHKTYQAIARAERRILLNSLQEQ